MTGEFRGLFSVYLNLNLNPVLNDLRVLAAVCPWPYERPTSSWSRNSHTALRQSQLLYLIRSVNVASRPLLPCEDGEQDVTGMKEGESD
jgi:hypothetical protein